MLLHSVTSAYHLAAESINLQTSEKVAAAQVKNRCVGMTFSGWCVDVVLLRDIRESDVSTFTEVSFQSPLLRGSVRQSDVRSNAVQSRDYDELAFWFFSLAGTGSSPSSGQLFFPCGQYMGE